MRVVELLSDLTTLRPDVCVRHPIPPEAPAAIANRCSKDQKAAIALVHARPEGQVPMSSSSTENSDPDLKRAKDLLELHADVKLAHADGTDRELIEARQAVERVLRDL